MKIANPSEYNEQDTPARNSNKPKFSDDEKQVFADMRRKRKAQQKRKQKVNG